jgi:hypothetical protein
MVSGHTALESSQANTCEVLGNLAA